MTVRPQSNPARRPIRIGHRMPQYWSHTRRWLAVCLAATAVGAPQCIAAEPPPGNYLPIQGEAVDDVPVVYRLPLVGSDDAADAVPLACQPSTATDILTMATPRSALPFPANSTGLTAQLLPAVQRGSNLARRGAFFAARTEFIQVLRRVAQAKDAAAGTDEFSVALAAGLRAMDEAEDFIPRGAQLEGELNLRSVASAHRTPVLRDNPEIALPHEAVARYHKFAQERLALASYDEQAGSMALYGLGKVYANLAERRDDDVQCVRGAMTMYSAALDACPSNNLAANELGVLLCRTGHPTEAIHNFQRAIDVAPTATAYHNLAVAQQRLSLTAESAANELESQRLAAIERATGAVSRRAGVEWVTPDVLARVSQPATLPSAETGPVTAARQPMPPQHKWR